MWVSGITQGLMWRATDAQGALEYPNFVETLNAIRPMYWMRLVGGSMYLVGMLLMAYNLARTALAGKAVDGEATVVVERSLETEVPWAEILFGKPVILVTVVAVIVSGMAVVNNEASLVLAAIFVVVAILGTIALHLAVDRSRPRWHRLLEGRALLFASFTVIAVLVGGVAELVPTLLVTPNDPRVLAEAKPYRALELEGRDIYVREGCYGCHSQMIRPFAFETKRYGDASTMSESVYDHPFQWGSKRTGPDLAREGGKYPNLWHYRHLIDPRSVSPGSNMPPYPTLATDKVDLARTATKMHALQSIGVPYEAREIDHASADAEAQGAEIAKNLARRRGRRRQPARGDRRAHRVPAAARGTSGAGARPGRGDADALMASANRIGESLMYKDLFAQSPLLVMPLVAMFLFLAVFVAVAIRAMTHSRVEMEAAARLPLGDDHERR